MGSSGVCGVGVVCCSMGGSASAPSGSSDSTGVRGDSLQEMSVVIDDL